MAQKKDAKKPGLRPLRLDPPCKVQDGGGNWYVRVSGSGATTDPMDQVTGVVMIMGGMPMPDYGSAPGQPSGDYNFDIRLTNTPGDEDTVQITIFLGLGLGMDTLANPPKWKDLPTC